jgi:predicted dehydrogenase
VRDVRALLEDPEIRLIVTAAIPSERAEIALEAMRHGKDVMVDKPGVIREAQLADIVYLQRQTGRIRSTSPSASRCGR